MLGEQIYIANQFSSEASLSPWRDSSKRYLREFGISRIPRKCVLSIGIGQPFRIGVLAEPEPNTIGASTRIIILIDPRTERAMNMQNLLDSVRNSGVMKRLSFISVLGQSRGLMLVGGLHVLLGLTCCAPLPSDADARAEYERVNDPAEPTNRKIFAVNKFLDDNALQPVARAHEDHVPDAVRRGIHNFVDNLAQPEIAANDVLQGNFSRAWNTSKRFGTNSTFGCGGLFDVASDWGIPSHDADFGQTLGVWGVGPGPAVQVPLLGPSNARDATGTVIGLVLNPVELAGGGAATAVRSASDGLGAVDSRASSLSATDTLESTSVDYYATLRSVTAQRREHLVAEGKQGNVLPSEADASLIVPDGP